MIATGKEGTLKMTGLGGLLGTALLPRSLDSPPVGGRELQSCEHVPGAGP